MSLISCPSVRNDGVVFRQCFGARRYVQDASGVLVGCTVGRYEPGIKTTAASSRVTYDNTRALLINSSKMTMRVKLRTGSTVSANTDLIDKTANALNDNQWLFIIAAGPVPVLYVAASAADLANYAVSATVLAVNSTYVLHAVYDGSLAAGSRVIHYTNGSAPGTVITGVIPTAMRASASPVTLFNRDGGNTRAPDTSATVFDVCLWDRALSAADVALDAADRTFLP